MALLYLLGVCTYVNTCDIDRFLGELDKAVGATVEKTHSFNTVL